MAAAVADFTPKIMNGSKLKKTELPSITLKNTPDILRKVGERIGKRFVIGFAAETGKNIENAKKKLAGKNLDLVVLNDVTQKGAGFGVDTNIITIIDRKGRITDYPLMKKIEAANSILDRMLKAKAERKERI